MADIKLDFDDSGALQGIDKTVAALEELEKQSKETGAAVNQSFVDAAQGAKVYEKAIEQAANQTNVASTAVKTNEKVLTGWRARLQGAVQTLKDGAASARDWAKGLFSSGSAATQQAAATEKATIAQRLLNLVMRANPIGLLIAGISALIGLLGRLQPIMDKIAQVSAGAGAAINSLTKSVGLFANGLKDVFTGNFSKGFSEMASAVTGVGSEMANAAIEAYNLEAAFQALRDAQIQSRVEAFKQTEEIAKLRDVGADETLTIRGRIAALQQASSVSADFYSREIGFAKQAFELEKQRFETTLKGNDDIQALQDAEINFLKTQSDAQKEQREIEQAIREARKEAARERKKQLEDEANLLKQAAKLRVEVLQDGIRKELEAEELRFQELVAKIEETNKKIIELNKRRSADNQEPLIKVERAEVQHQENLAEIRLKYFLADLALQNAQLEAEKESLENGFAELEKLQADSAEERIKIAKDAKAIQDKFAEVDAATFEGNQLALRKAFFSRKRSADEIKKFEEQLADEKERFDLRQQAKALQRQLDFDKTLTEVEKISIQKRINNLNEAIDQVGEGKAKEPFSFAKLLGLTDDQFKAVEDGVSRIIDSINPVLDARIEAARKERELAEERVKLAEETVEKEKEQQEKGNANNLALAQKQLADEKAARDKALKEEQDATRAKNALETLQQTTSLITASANIFQSLSAIPFVGVPLAIALIATMFTAFAAAKINATKASKTPLRAGGKLSGPDHEHGGIDIDINGRPSRFNAEGDEWVINRKDSKEHDNFLHDLNRGKFRGVDVSKAVAYYFAGVKPGAGVLHGHALMAQDASKKMDAATSDHVTRKQFEALQRELIETVKNRPHFAPWKNGYKQITIGQHFRETRTVQPNE